MGAILELFALCLGSICFSPMFTRVTRTTLLSYCYNYIHIHIQYWTVGYIHVHKYLALYECPVMVYASLRLCMPPHTLCVSVNWRIKQKVTIFFRTIFFYSSKCLFHVFPSRPTTLHSSTENI